MNRSVALLALSLCLCGTALRAQGDRNLTDTVAALDDKLFHAYNTCDLATLGSMVTDDLEFYHDQTGLSVGKDKFLSAIRQNVCGKVERTLLKQTLEVYPLKNYGAVEIGIHRFRHPAHPEDAPGDAKFVNLWQLRDGTWLLTRVISYQHNEGLLVKQAMESTAQPHPPRAGTR